MNKKIFRSTFAATICVFLVSVVLIMGILYGYLESRVTEELKTEVKFLSHAIENEGVDYFENFESKTNRITLIDSDGKVVADTVANPQEMDNHLNRHEVQQALETGTGTSSRYSSTLMEKTIYYAARLSDGKILRVSTTQYSVITVFLGLLQPMIIVLVFALILSLLLSSKVSKSIIKPINSINPDIPEEVEIYEELSPLLSKIAAQKKTINNQLKEANRMREEFRAITENMSEGFLVIDANANLLTYNSAALKLLDIESVTVGSVLTLNRTQSFREAVTSALDGKRTECVMSHGEQIYNLIASPVWEDNNTIGAVITILDITENAKRETLRREFTANVSHELKTPLTSIYGFAELMKNGGTTEQNVIDFSTTIFNEAQRLVSLVNDIIKISELDEKTVQYETEEIDLYYLADDVISRLEFTAEKKGVTLELKGESAEITGVRKIIDEMVYNLLENAIKYNKENGRAEITVENSDKEIKITVSDTGIGIPKAHHNRVFERFYRVDKSHSRAIGGTGLGLSIVKHAASYHNARITLQSDEGKGTDITVTFPKD